MATKFHKSGQRFVAGLSLCSTSNLSSVLSDVCNFVLETLRQQDDKRIKRTGIRRFFVVNGYEEVAFFLHSWKFHSHANSLKTGDFSTMYTSLPLKKLKYNIRFALTEAWLYVAEDLGCDWYGNLDPNVFGPALGLRRNPFTKSRCIASMVKI